MLKGNKMKINKLIFYAGIFGVGFFSMTGIIIPQVVSSTLPLLLIIAILISIPVCFYFIIKLFLIKKRKPKRKCHEKSSIEGKTKKFS
jgi:quinol-cytochrome oxidoreductase complex cytochrome b subunit